MFNVGGGEILVILLVALLVLGPDKLPGAARSAGKVMRDVRKMSSAFQQEMRSAMDSVDLDGKAEGGKDLHPGLGPGPSLPALGAAEIPEGPSQPATGATGQVRAKGSVRSDGPPTSFS